MFCTRDGSSIGNALAEVFFREGLQPLEAQEMLTGWSAVLRSSTQRAAHCLYCRSRYMRFTPMSAFFHSLIVLGDGGVPGNAKGAGPFLLEKPPNMIQAAPSGRCD